MRRNPDLPKGADVDREWRIIGESDLYTLMALFSKGHIVKYIIHSPTAIVYQTKDIIFADREMDILTDGEWERRSPWKKRKEA
jgi:hypothetical protein